GTMYEHDARRMIALVRGLALGNAGHAENGRCAERDIANFPVHRRVSFSMVRRKRRRCGDTTRAAARARSSESTQCEANLTSKGFAQSKRLLRTDRLLRLKRNSTILDTAQ